MKIREDGSLEAQTTNQKILFKIRDLVDDFSKGTDEINAFLHPEIPYGDRSAVIEKAEEKVFMLDAIMVMTHVVDYDDNVHEGIFINGSSQDFYNLFISLFEKEPQMAMIAKDALKHHGSKY
jgi:hypothetical protein